MNITIECPVCGNKIEDKDSVNVEASERFPYMYYIKAICNKCDYFMLFKMERDGKVIWSFDDTIENEIKVNLKGE